ncbi:hypothetical protein GH714_009875 [Hevea brasiliensis]|uniref:Uncharacterized protein n=1 Tax=Hevea brasiliensis TaxID=3981 RepID=A0A6A6KZB4_HEVBR|nr:hypothetical protein GH714_009875 [Hevea brasiliensis]
MGGGNVEKAEAIQSSLFTAAINTFSQILLGSQLPVVMQISEAFIIPAISIAISTNNKFSATLTPRQLAKCIEIGLPAVAIVIFSTQFLPYIWKPKRPMLVRSVVITISIAIAWTFAEILTVAGAYNNASQEKQNNCRTDRSGLIPAAPWIKVPNPFQWGYPTFEVRDIFLTMAASFVATIESIGTFSTSSRLGGEFRAKPPNSMVQLPDRELELYLMQFLAWDLVPLLQCKE